MKALLAGALAAVVVVNPATTSAAKTFPVKLRFDKLEANIGAVPGFPGGNVVDLALRDVRRGGNLMSLVARVYMATSPEERRSDVTNSTFQMYREGSAPGDDELDRVEGMMRVKKEYISTTPSRQKKRFSGMWELQGQGRGAMFAIRRGKGRVEGYDDCTASGCRGYIRFTGTFG